MQFVPLYRHEGIDVHVLDGGCPLFDLAYFRDDVLCTQPISELDGLKLLTFGFLSCTDHYADVVLDDDIGIEGEKDEEGTFQLVVEDGLDPFWFIFVPRICVGVFLEEISVWKIPKLYPQFKTIRVSVEWTKADRHQA